MLVGYMRVFTTDDRQSIEVQRHALVSAGVDELQIAQGRASGAESDCLSLRQYLNCLKRGDTLVVWRLDRLSRSITGLLSIVTELGKRGVGIRSLTEAMAIDMTTAEGRLMFSVFDALTEYRRALMREQVCAGIEDARKQGRRVGRPPSIDSEKLDQIMAKLAAGASKASVCRTFGVSRSTLHDTLGRVEAQEAFLSLSVSTIEDSDTAASRKRLEQPVYTSLSHA